LAGLAALGLALAYGPRGGMGGPQQGMKAGLADAMHNKVPTLLGITLEEFVALRQSGKTLAQIAQERGVDLAKLEAQLVGIRNAAIDEAVKAGAITEAQAVQMKARNQEMVKIMLQKEVGPMGGAQAYGRRAGQDVAPGTPKGPGHPTQRGSFGPGRNR
ncbi:MAG: hypothetical protein ABWU19_15075, partial [Meiothermus cerbereus]